MLPLRAVSVPYASLKKIASHCPFEKLIRSLLIQLNEKINA
jgi:hypothetical protein